MERQDEVDIGEGEVSSTFPNLKLQSQLIELLPKAHRALFQAVDFFQKVLIKKSTTRH